MPHNRLANFDLLLLTSLKHAERANLSNLEDMKRLQSKWKSFVEMTNEELGNTEKIARSLEAWNELFDDKDAGIHPEAGSFAYTSVMCNYIRAGKILISVQVVGMCSCKNRELGRFYIIYICKLYWKS